jgi:sphingosine kinase
MASFLSVGWGLIADVDMESEPLRCLGGIRFTIWGLHRIVNSRNGANKSAGAVARN